jgi:capsular exopolysaccharide synthesis family protein
MFTETGLGHYSKVIWQYLWLIFLIIILCTGTTFVINQRTPLVYEASALIQVHDTQTTNNNVFTDQALAQSYALLVKSPEVLQAVAKKIPGVSPQQLASQVSDSPLDNTQILQIRATAETPNLATDIANTVAQVFIKQQTDRTITQLKITALKLSQNLTNAKQILDKDQTELANLQNEQASPDRIAHQNDIISNDQISYNALQASYNQVQQQILQAPNILTIVQPATPPTTSNSHTLLNTIIAAALSLLIMLIFILLRDWIDTTIKTPNDVERLACLRALGSIPLRKKALEDDEDETDSHVALIKDEVITQAFVGIRTYFSTYGKGKQTFVVTSLHTKAGTSTVAAHLALSLAQSGVRVLLIDAHLQKPSLQQLFKGSTTLGLTTVLTDYNWLQNANAHQVYNWLSQWQTHVPNLWFLPAGPTISQQASIMLSPVLPMFLQNILKPVPHSTKHGPTSSFIDVIIFDTPPLEMTTDTLAIAACADASLLVIKAGKEQPQMVQKAQEILTRLQAPTLGVIVNYQTPKHQPYFYTNSGQAYRDAGDVGAELAPSTPTHALENAQRSNATFAGTGQAQAGRDESLPDFAGSDGLAPTPRVSPRLAPQPLSAPSPTETPNERELPIPSSTQGTTSIATLEKEPASSVPTPAEKPSGQTLPAIAPTPNNASLGLGQLLSNAHTKSEASTYKGQK